MQENILAILVAMLIFPGCMSQANSTAHPESDLRISNDNSCEPKTGCMSQADNTAHQESDFDVASDNSREPKVRMAAIRRVLKSACDKKLTISQLATLGSWNKLLGDDSITDASTDSLLPPFKPTQGSVVKLVFDIGIFDNGDGYDLRASCIHIQLSQYIKVDKFKDYLFGRESVLSDVTLLDCGWLFE